MKTCKKRNYANQLNNGMVGIVACVHNTGTGRPLNLGVAVLERQELTNSRVSSSQGYMNGSSLA